MGLRGLKEEEKVMVVGEKVDRKSIGFRITDRDLSILSFLLDQKFASLAQVYFRFFDKRESVNDPLPQGFHVTRQRLNVLKRAGLIHTEKVYTEGKSVYLLTTTGLKILEGRRPNDAYAQPVKSVDFRSYEHDSRVNDCRIGIERTGKVLKWLSDRRLKMEGFQSHFSGEKLPKSVIPDGVFVTSRAERIVFELETSIRKRSRYRDKMHDLRSVMWGEQPLFHRVIWVGSTEKIMSDLRKVVGERRGFVVESYGHFLGKLWPGGVKK